jgi:hypothetical protein
MALSRELRMMRKLSCHPGYIEHQEKTIRKRLEKGGTID